MLMSTNKTNQNIKVEYRERSRESCAIWSGKNEDKRTDHSVSFDLIWNLILQSGSDNAN